MKLYLDENLSPRMAGLLRTRGLDAVSAHDVGKTGLDDRSQLRYAIAEGRAIVTADIVDFVDLDREWLAAGLEHCGMILIPATVRARDFARIVAGIAEIVRLNPAGLRGVVVYG